MSVEGIRLMNGLLWQQKGPPRRSGAHKYFGLAPAAAVGDLLLDQDKRIILQQPSIEQRSPKGRPAFAIRKSPTA
jgi:hypothetical protein